MWPAKRGQLKVEKINTGTGNTILADFTLKVDSITVTNYFMKMYLPMKTKQHKKKVIGLLLDSFRLYKNACLL